jgi:hypothetical protein
MLKMVKLKKGQTVATLQKEASTKHDNAKEEKITVLQKLVSEETNLMEEKKNLVLLKEKLQLKLEEEIEIKKENIQKLKGEIANLKVTCESLSKSIKAEAK